MRLARKKFEERCGPPPRGSFMPLKGSATITGVAFFDVKHSNPQHGVAPNNIELHPVLRFSHPDYEPIPHLLVLRIESPLIYANATLVRDRVKYLVGASDPLPKAVVLDIGVNDELDITSAEILEQLVGSLRAAGIDFALADVRQPVIRRMRREGLVDKINEKMIFHTVDEAVRALNETQ